MEKKTKIETVSSSLPIQISTTLLAAGTIAAGPIAPLLPLLPLLVGSLAGNRHAKRVENAIIQIEAVLKECRETLLELTDPQYKFLNEAVLTILQTTDDEKIDMLRQAIRKSIEEDLASDEAILLSRVLRDISVGELKLLIRIGSTPVVQHSGGPEGAINIEMNSNEGMNMHGLVSSGLLRKDSPEGVWDDHGTYSATTLSSKLLRLLQDA